MPDIKKEKRIKEKFITTKYYDKRVWRDVTM